MQLSKPKIVRGGARDTGIDVVVIQNGEKVVVQCKRYAANHKVSSAEVQRFVGAIQIERASRGIFISTSNFTAEARAIASKEGIVLVGEIELAAMIDQAFANARSAVGKATLSSQLHT